MHLRRHFLQDFLQKFLTGWLRCHLGICLLQATDIALLKVFLQLFLAIFVHEYFFLQFHFKPFGYVSLTQAIAMEIHYSAKKSMSMIQKMAYIAILFHYLRSLQYRLYIWTNRRNWGCIWHAVIASYHFHPCILLHHTMGWDCCTSFF